MTQGRLHYIFCADVDQGEDSRNVFNEMGFILGSGGKQIRQT